MNTMARRALGRTGLEVSAIAMGTAQLRLVPEAQALATLRTAFAAGIDLVHTAPDYEGADRLTGRAIREAGLAGRIRVASQGWGTADHLERQLDETCRRLGTDRMDLFGIASLRDRELLGEEVWGRDGMVARLHRLKEQGRIRAVYCTTHGGPDHLRELAARDAFDAVMLAWNPLGFHLLSYNPDTLWSLSSAAGRPPHWEFERMSEHRECMAQFHARGVGVLVMKPLAGGLLAPGRAFPERFAAATRMPDRPAARVLRSIAAEPFVSSVVVGMASPAEVQENAPAGQADAPAVAMPLLAHDLCSRCGACDSTCSSHLPVSWLFRAAYIHARGSETFETWDDVEYFRLHPSATSACAACSNVTCSCPQGIDIPGSLQRLHTELAAGRREGWVRNPTSEPADAEVLLLTRERRDGLLRLWIENRSSAPWPRDAKVVVRGDGGLARSTSLRDDVEPRGRFHAVVDWPADAPIDALHVRIARRRLLRPALTLAQTTGR